MDVGEYGNFDAVGLAELVRDRQVSPAELLACAREAVERVDPDINAIVHKLDDPVAGNANGPLAGVPFLVKDLVLHIKDVPHSMGSRLLKDAGHVSQADSELFSRFKAAGLVTIGVTNSPEFGFNPSSESVAFKPTRNPYDLSRSAGGSSGGSCAAVSAGIVPVAHANDGGGSIRIPAAACGLVGLKPTRGRTPVGPDTGFPLLGLGIEFANSRTVRDTALLLDCVEGPETGAVFDIPRPKTSYSEAIRQPTPRLKIAVCQGVPGAPAVASCMSDAVARTAQLLEQQGHIVEQAAPQYDPAAFHDANFTAWVSFVAAAASELCAAYRTVPAVESFEAVTLACIEAGNRMRAVDIERAFAHMNELNRLFGQFMSRYDALLSPVSIDTVPKIGYFDQNDPNISARGWHDKVFDFYPFTAQFNITGQPAIVLPAGLNEGLPVGIQFAGRMGDEPTLLQIARDLEEAQPWRDVRPPIHVGNQ